MCCFHGAMLFPWCCSLKGSIFLFNCLIYVQISGSDWVLDQTDRRKYNIRASKGRFRRDWESWPLLTRETQASARRTLSQQKPISWCRTFQNLGGIRSFWNYSKICSDQKTEFVWSLSAQKCLFAEFWISHCSLWRRQWRCPLATSDEFIAKFFWIPFICLLEKVDRSIRGRDIL